MTKPFLCAASYNAIVLMVPRLAVWYIKRANKRRLTDEDRAVLAAIANRWTMLGCVSATVSYIYLAFV